MKILFVDNHAGFAAIVRSAFLATHEVVTVTTVAAARAAAEASAFDVALVDYDLDDGKGDEFVRWVRSAEAHEALPLIAISARAEGNDALLQAGADCACAKADFARIAAVLDAVARPHRS